MMDENGNANEHKSLRVKYEYNLGIIFSIHFAWITSQRQVSNLFVLI